METKTEFTAEAIAELLRPKLKFLTAGREIAPDESLADLGLDSMTAIDLLVDLEERFGIQIDDDALTENSFVSIREIEALAQASGAAG